jgi:ferric-dicitrate binding protein FerR (iron transport regulator)
MMIYKEKQKHTIDLAWEHLYNRLEQDNLLPKKELSRRTIFHSNGFRWAASVAILCICSVSVWLINQRTNIHGNDLLVISNEKNAPTLATTLEDGSIVYLSEQATIQYPEHFQEDKRMISLQGDAFFEISKQQGRPFFIDTELAEIEVLGTFFHVKSSAKSAFLLSVRNGEVKVTLKKNNQTTYIKAGEAALWESGNLRLTEADMYLFNTYFEKIHFKDERLADIARIINQHSALTRIEVSPELEYRQLNITFFSEETTEMKAKQICMALNLTYSQQQNTIFITQ